MVTAVKKCPMRSLLKADCGHWRRSEVVLQQPLGDAPFLPLVSAAQSPARETVGYHEFTAPRVSPASLEGCLRLGGNVWVSRLCDVTCMNSCCCMFLITSDWLATSHPRSSGLISHTHTIIKNTYCTLSCMCINSPLHHFLIYISNSYQPFN